ncbi:MAG: VVA0879 family protein [Umezawaea sp.]
MSTDTTTGGYRFTQQQLCDEARARFGDDPKQWAFKCPTCSDIATAQDFIDAGADPQRTGQECIGRSLGALTKDAIGTDGQAHAKRGCDWAAYGLFSGPWLIQVPLDDGSTKKIPSFPLATADEAASARQSRADAATPSETKPTA